MTIQQEFKDRINHYSKTVPEPQMSGLHATSFDKAMDIALEYVLTQIEFKANDRIIHCIPLKGYFSVRIIH